ncbi:hypothetical protein [Thalassoroseus pseudoceratinae]|uniref:hypothetical protein n=1 Tax=Thalassoroseus pseudoceratinae TaxID=2713176 RepID=UPI001421F575|nr:hypothetical protein [Thalassoroseus pseudoceratinae]
MKTLVNLHQKLTPRLAERLHSCLNSARAPAPRVWPVAVIERIERLLRLETKAYRRGWISAAAVVRSQLQSALTDLQERLAQLRSQVDLQPPSTSSLRDLIADINALQCEFEQVEVNLSTSTLAVTTSPVVHEDVFLGPFRIALSFAAGQSSTSYTVTALEPHPAASDDAITHPHIQDGHLCEGEGRLPLRRALEDGRVFDVFQIIQQILTTYNSGSAYVSLDDWHGVPCVTCGMSTSDDERTSCQLTGEPLCWECAVSCSDCERTLAPDRTECCSECDDQFCSACLDQGICHACQDEIETEAEPVSSDRADAPVHTLCLEQTALSAGPG